jgi:hypothetical protein
MADSKISDLPESADPNPLSKVITAYNGQNYQVPLTSLVSSASAPKFVFYLNSSGTANRNSTSESLNFIDGANNYQIATTRFASYTECIHWLNRNIVSGGLADIIFETNITETRNNEYAAGTSTPIEMNVYGNKVMGEYFSLGVFGETPTSSNIGARKTLTISGTAHQNIVNYIQFWNAGRTTYAGLKFDIRNLNPIGRGFGLFRFSYSAGGYNFIQGCTIKVDAGNSSYAIPRLIEGDSGNIFLSPLQGYWRSGFDRTDPFFAGSPLAALEVQVGSTTNGIINLFDVVRGSNSGITEFSYAGYGANAYTANARIHAIGNVSVTNFCYIDSSSLFSTNGMGATKTSSGSFAATQCFKAIAFNTITLTKYDGTLSSTSGLTSQILPGAKKFHSDSTANVDYRLSGTSSSSFSASNTSVINATTYSK